MPTLPVLVDGGRASRSSRSELGLRGFGMVGSSFSPLSRFFHFEEAVDWFSDRFQEEIGNCLRLEISVQGEVRIYRMDRVVFLFFFDEKGISTVGSFELCQK